MPVVANLSSYGGRINRFDDGGGKDNQFAFGGDLGDKNIIALIGTIYRVYQD